MEALLLRQADRADVHSGPDDSGRSGRWRPSDGQQWASLKRRRLGHACRYRSLGVCWPRGSAWKRAGVTEERERLRPWSSR